jgi:hypothetical protein
VPADLGIFFWNIPDADGYMVACSRTLTFGLADMHQPPSDGRKPLIDVIFVGRFHDCLSVTTYEGEHSDSLFHR